MSVEVGVLVTVGVWVSTTSVDVEVGVLDTCVVGVDVAQYDPPNKSSLRRGPYRTPPWKLLITSPQNASVCHLQGGNSAESSTVSPGAIVYC